MIDEQLSRALQIDAIAPSGPTVTATDKKLTPIYIEILDRAEAKEPWEATALALLQIDPETAPKDARKRYESYLKRAIWMRDIGAAQLLGGRNPEQAFRIWAAEILVRMTKAGDIPFSGSGCVEVWADEIIDGLISDQSLQADPEMNAKECAQRLQRLLGATR